MIDFIWYQIFNVTEFEALAIVSKEYTYDLGDMGEKTVLVTKGNFVGVTYEGVYVALNMNDKNPFYIDGVALYVDDNDDVWLGIESAD